jgi:hypothetical protein
MLWSLVTTHTTLRAHNSFPQLTFDMTPPYSLSNKRNQHARVGRIFMDLPPAEKLKDCCFSHWPGPWKA